ncbi:MAG: LON peptidase substrate-binding domain-containing protein [Proteobacteria bacterium]|nr:LON peptidase substrate-binding domain-containing protein [Pseudomonadota bacterium]
MKNIDTGFTKILPLLPVKDTVLFPNMVIPILVKTEKYLPLIEEAMEKDKLIVVAMMGDEEKEAAKSGDFRRIGTAASVIKLSKGDEGTVAVVQGLFRVALSEIVSHEPYFMAKVERRG